MVELGEPGAEVFVHVHHHVREDAQTLYGFPTRDERDCFEALLGAHGVGPALALAILSVHGPSALRHRGRRRRRRRALPGARRRQEDGGPPARRAEVAARACPCSTSTSGRGADPRRARPSARSDVRDALANLGYQPDEVAAVVRDLPDDGDVSDLLKAALQRLAVG